MKIKANQGHSIKVELNFKTKVPPTILYHGTQISNEAIIRKKGISKMKRHHVHLSADINTATAVAKRRGPKIVIFEIDCKAMFKDNIKFYISDNEVWLTDYIDPKYIK
jgi:putative RNA 2'-phosphotransferase